MRGFLSVFIFISFTPLWASEFFVFEKDGFFGIRDNAGQVTVPAVYEKLGWSNGASEVVDGVIGFSDGNAWGLISVKNKPLTDQKYYSLEPFTEKKFKASIKGNYSNLLFYGILDQHGKTVISFNFFSIEQMKKDLLVSGYEQGSPVFGIITYQNKKVIPMRYESLDELHSYFYAKQFDGSRDLYTANGKLIVQSLDSTHRTNKGIIAFKKGKAGFINLKGAQTKGFTYKNFRVEDGILFPIPFPQWQVYKGFELIHELETDSVRMKNDKLVNFFNGGAFLVAKDSTIQWVREEYKVGVVKEDYDSIIITSNFAWVKQNEAWTLLDLEANKKSRSTYQQISKGLKNQFIVKMHDHWGVIDQLGNNLTSNKFDSIVYDPFGYKIKYLNKWGLMDTKGSWRIWPEFAEVTAFPDFEIGRKGMAYSYFIDGGVAWRSTAKPEYQLGASMIIRDENGKIGLINKYFQVVANPTYDSIALFGKHYVLQKSGQVSLISENGKLIISEESGIESIEGFAENYFLIIKNGRYGFMDNRGRLRISNRYEEAKTFSEGLAAIKLRDRWGFIDKSETIIVQPNYSSVQAFSNGLAIVKSNDGFGLINKKGHEVISPQWYSIRRLPTGNYLVIDDTGKKGMVTQDGTFILRPTFDELEDHDGKVVVEQDGKCGLLDYSGKQILKILHKEILISDDYTFVKY